MLGSIALKLGASNESVKTLADSPEVKALDARPWLIAVDGLSEMPQRRWPHIDPSFLLLPQGQEIIAVLDALLSSTSRMKLLLTSRHRLHPALNVGS